VLPALRACRSRLGVWLWAGLMFLFLGAVGVWPDGAAAPLNPETRAATHWPLLGIVLLALLALPAWLVSRVARQLVAGLAMAAALYGLQLVLASWFDRGALRYIAVAILVGAGLAVYFPLVWILGGTDREELKSLLRRRRPYTDAA